MKRGSADRGSRNDSGPSTTTGLRRILAESPGGRVFIALSFVDAFGTGLFLAAGAVFLTRYAGLTNTQVGAGLTVAGLIGLTASIPLGPIADRVGARRLMVIVQFWRAACFIAYLAVSGPVTFIVVAACLGAAQGISAPLSQAVVPLIMGERHRVQALALVRVVRNVAFSFGALVSAPLIAADSRGALQLVVVLNAASFVAAGFLLARTPLAPGAARTTRIAASPLTALREFRDWRYMSAAALNVIFTVHMPLLALVVPLWVLTHTDAPPAVISVLLLLNTAMAVLLQVPLSRRASTVAGSARLMTRAGFALVTCCVLMALASAMPTWWAVVLLVVSMVALTLGEIWQSAAAWSISYEFAPADRRVQYLAIFNISVPLANDVLGPFLLAGVLIDWGKTGWLLLAALILISVPAFNSAVRRLQHGPTRQYVDPARLVASAR